MNEFTNPPDVTTYLLPDDGRIPNNPILPLLIYGGALRLSAPAIAPDPARFCEKLYSANGWGGGWRNGIYSFHHYHSTAHEMLIIARGQAEVHFGGESGPRLSVVAGDAVIIPAGVGHKNMGSSGDMLVIGAYPPGQTWDLLRGDPGERPRALDNIARVPLPETDPIYGTEGPLLTHWQINK
jgi:uncharacterized protein YjlB